METEKSFPMLPDPFKKPIRACALCSREVDVANVWWNEPAPPDDHTIIKQAHICEGCIAVHWASEDDPNIERMQ